jgi:hypothetical protein
MCPERLQFRAAIHYLMFPYVTLIVLWIIENAHKDGYIHPTPSLFIVLVSGWKRYCIFISFIARIFIWIFFFHRLAVNCYLFVRKVRDYIWIQIFLIWTNVIDLIKKISQHHQSVVVNQMILTTMMDNIYYWTNDIVLINDIDMTNDRISMVSINDIVLINVTDMIKENSNLIEIMEIKIQDTKWKSFLSLLIIYMLRNLKTIYIWLSIPIYFLLCKSLWKKTKDHTLVFLLLLNRSLKYNKEFEDEHKSYFIIEMDSRCGWSF